MDDYFKNVFKILGIGAAFASLPLFASLASLQPPWPPAIGFVSSALVMLGALITWELTRKTKIKNRRRTILLSALLTLVGLGIYLALYSYFVVNITAADGRVIIGYQCTAEARMVYTSQCPELSTSALDSAGWKPLTLWTRWSVTVVRLSLVSSWLLFTTGLIMATGAVVAGRKF